MRRPFDLMPKKLTCTVPLGWKAMEKLEPRSVVATSATASAGALKSKSGSEMAETPAAVIAEVVGRATAAVAGVGWGTTIFFVSGFSCSCSTAEVAVISADGGSGSTIMMRPRRKNKPR
jgi:DNA-binding transcriptional regulator LsrR (DeoR family)